MQALVRVVAQKCRCISLIPHVTQAYTSRGDFRQIVTGVAERGGETEIRYWIQEPESDTKKATELKSHAAQEPGRVHHTTHVRYRISGPPIPAEALLADASSNNCYYHVQHRNPLGRNAVGYDHIVHQLV